MLILSKSKSLHYCAAGSKPWRYNGEGENMEREDIKFLVQKWWEIYDDESLDYGFDADLNADEAFLAAQLEDGVVKLVTAPPAA
ncbi:Hexosyltransferase [Quillaja saponaria]|uniref:Hexosyltransferase n=1 Tax=Quillaja saponaria TaxID=32244 RepID=A0AAD7QAD4_QUISA|nr:Hexosyltransferase [Quillaja saponaria]